MSATEEPTSFREAMFNELEAPGSITKSRIRNLLIRYPERVPRTITTEGELSGLPQGTKLYSTKTTHSWNLNDLSQHGGTKVQGTGGGYTYIEDFIKHEAPLVVLYIPEDAA